jgi:hypothetical protein
MGFKAFRFSLIFCCILLIDAVKMNAQFQLVFNELYLSVGDGISDFSTSGTDDFVSIAPNSQFANYDYSIYSLNRENPDFNTGTRGEFLVSFQIKNKSTGNIVKYLKFNTGLVLQNRTPIKQIFQNMNRYNIDVIASETSGRVIYIDSIINSTHSKTYSATLFGPSTGFTLHSNQEKWISVHARVGFAFGATFNNSAYIRQSKNWDYEEWSPTNNSINFSRTVWNTLYDQNISERQEIFSTKMGFGYSAFMAYGVSVRLSKKADFFKNIYLGGELQIASDFTYIPELSGSRSNLVSGGNFSIRYVLNQ